MLPLYIAALHSIPPVYDLISVWIQWFCEGLRGLFENISEQNSITKTMEHLRQVRENIVEKFKARLSYRAMLQALHISS